MRTETLIRELRGEHFRKFFPLYNATFGDPEKIEVSGTLSGFPAEEGSFVKDLSGLADLKNARGEEDWSAGEDGAVYWQNLGEDIHYEGISERELAEICGLPHSSVARIESCSVKPKVDTLLKIMKPLGLTLITTSF